MYFILPNMECLAASTKYGVVVSYTTFQQDLLLF